MGYPSVDAYLARLPLGLASYPDSKAKGVIFRDLLSERPFGSDPSRLPPELQALVERPPAASAWVPEAYLSALLLARTDHLGITEDQAVEWVYQRNLALLSHPLYRLLLMVVKPSLLLKGVSSRFESFHLGMTLAVLPRTETEWSLVMGFRDHLLPPLAVKAYATAFRAALEIAGANQVKVELVESSHHHGTFRATWAP